MWDILEGGGGTKQKNNVHLACGGTGFAEYSTITIYSAQIL